MLSDLLRLASKGGEKSSSISEILKLSLAWFLGLKAVIMIYRIGERSPNFHSHTTRKRLPRHLGLCPPIDKEENVPIGDESEALRLHLVIVFATCESVTELDF